ncbi:MAG: hypothetical protein P8J64_06355 [Dehalococcoidia bacterium]|jgi:hypothetical protein|nr:hypothetical protein [Dehalococcoidia bacterium]
MKVAEYQAFLSESRRPFSDLLERCSVEQLTAKPNKDSWCSLETFEHLVQSDVYHFSDILRPLGEDKFDLITIFRSRVETDGNKVFDTIPSPDGEKSRSELLVLQNEISKIFYLGLEEYAAHQELSESTLHHPVFGDLRGINWVNFYAFHDWNHYIQGAAAAKEIGVIPNYDPYGIPTQKHQP